MGYQQWLLLLVVVGLSFSVVLAEEEGCMRTMKNCTRNTGYSELLIVNDDVFCCFSGYTLRFDNDSQCFCNKTSQVVQCDTGPEVCGNNTESGITYPRTRPHEDGEVNVTHCCQQGYFMHFQRGFVNGTLTESCMCSSNDVKGFAVTSVKTSGPGVQLRYVSYQGQPFSGELPQNLHNWVQKQLQRMKNTFSTMWKTFFRGPGFWGL